MRRRERKSASGWDVVPTGSVPMFAGMVFPGNLLMTADGKVTNVEKQRKRLFVGNLPPGCTEMDLAAFVNGSLAIKCPGVVHPIVDCTANGEKNFGFIEFRDRREANIAIVALDGLIFNGFPIKTQRPKDYVPPTDAEEHGLLDAPDQLHLGQPQLPDSPNKLFVGGLPLAFDEQTVREVLQTVGAVKALVLSRDPFSNGASRGFAFCEYEDAANTDKAIAAFNGMPIEGSTLVVHRAVPAHSATVGPVVVDIAPAALFRPGDTITKATPPGVFLMPMPMPLLLAGVRGTQSHNGMRKNIAKPQEPDIKLDGGADSATAAATTGDAAANKEEGEDEEPASLPTFDPLTSERATRVVMLLNCVNQEELVSDDSYYDLLADVREEAEFYGAVREIRVPRRVEPEINEDPQPAPPGTGRIFIEFAELDSARRACAGMGGRLFDGRTVIATFYDEQAFANKQHGPPPLSALVVAEQQKQAAAEAAMARNAPGPNHRGGGGRMIGW